MKKFLKIISICLASLLIFLYVAFLITPPIFNAFYDLNKHKNDIQKIVKDNTKLNLDYSKIKIYTTPLLSAGLIIEDIKVTLNDNSTLLKTDKIKSGIALPSLLTLTIKTAKTDVINPYINLEILDDKQYKLISVVEEIINENNAKPKPQANDKSEFINKIVQNIKIKIPSIKITNYSALINDLKTNHNLKLTGEELLIGYNSAKNTFKIKTNAKLLSDNKENITAKIDILSSIPTVQEQSEPADPEEKIAIPFINLVSIYQTYGLKANIDSKLKIKDTKRGFISFGYFNIDNLNLKLSDIRLPDSYLHFKTHGKKIIFENNLCVKNDETLSLNGELKYGKKPRIKTTIKTQELHFSNLISLFAGLLDSLNIKNELATIKTTGYINADATIKTNFKKLKSQGSIVVEKGSFINPKNDIGIKDLAVNILLDNNILNIKNTALTINNSKLSAQGSIDTKSNTDIKLNIDNLSIPELYNAFAPKDLKKLITLNRANLSANIDIKGKLDNLNAKLNTKLNNLNLTDYQKTTFITNENLEINFNATPKAIEGNILNTNFNFNIPQLKTSGNIAKLNIGIDNNIITINPFDFIYNKQSKINIKGDINNYLKNPLINIFADGKISTQDINQTLGKDISIFIPSKGEIPLKISINGDSKKQEIISQIYSDANNYISPITLNSLENGQTLTHIDIKLQGSKLKLKDSGIYKTQNSFSNDLTLNKANTTQIIDLTTILDNGHINLFRINIPQTQAAKISMFKDSIFNTKGKITLSGKGEDLSFGGNLKIWDLSIPEILFKTSNIDLDFTSDKLNIKAKEINLNDSKINGSLKALLKPINNNFKLYDIEAKSDSINVDKVFAVLDNLMKYMPQPTQTTQAQTQNANIPLIADGKFDIKKLTTGAMLIENIKGNLNIKNNDLYISSLDCDAFKGKVKGNIKMNLLSGLMDIKLTGKKLDSDKTLSDAANMKNTISGDLDFKTDISLKGGTYEEQVKSLKGTVDFQLKDGQYGPFAKLENFFLAENIRENALFKNTLGVVLTPITTIDSTHYEDLSGNVSFNNGIVSLNSIKSQGNILCILVNGEMNLLSNELNSKVRVRLASAVSDMLGPIAMANPINLIKNTSGLNVANAKLFSMFSEVVAEEEYKEIPDFSKNHSDEYATKFQIILDGSLLKPLSLVKSFKWLVLQEDMDKAKEFSDTYTKQQLIEQLQNEYEQNHKLKVGVEKILKMDTTAPEVKKVIIEEIIKQKEQATQNTQQKIETKKEELETKIQETIETKKQEQEQKLLDIQNQLKSKLQEKLTIPASQGSI